MMPSWIEQGLEQNAPGFIKPEQLPQKLSLSEYSSTMNTESLPQHISLSDTTAGKDVDVFPEKFKLDPIGVDEKIVKGGRYADVKRTSDGSNYEVHHMPADSISNIERNDGPAIRMEKIDHRMTASYGNSKEAQEYRESQKKLIDEGRFMEAVQMDIDDIHEKFGDKYDDAIFEVQEYINQLKIKEEF